MLTRLSWSHVRFGSFQRHAYFDRADLVGALVDHVVELYYPELSALEGPGARAAPLLAAIAGRMALTVAAWMAAGFVHGVLNTDNMNVTGESFDYGPWRFLPRNDPGFTAAYFDQTGLYAFGRQPQAVFWNLQQLAACLTLLQPDPDALVAALNGFAPAYREAFRAALLARLGVQSAGEEADKALAQATLEALAEGGEGLRWEPLFYDWFGGDGVRALAGHRAALYRQPAARAFAERLRAHAPRPGLRLDAAAFAAADPEELLYEEVEALWAAIAEDDDWAPLTAKLARIRAAGEAYALAPAAEQAPDARVLVPNPNPLAGAFARPPS